MCGIAGIAGGPNDAATITAVDRMLAATYHRGPDDQGTHHAEGVCIGMNRLAILDLSAAGHQPMFAGADRYSIVYNGEIYNYRALRMELEALGEQFVSNADTEVLLRAYVVYGKACLDKIRGMFAFAIWDRQEEKLFAARDHKGIKPFVYSLQNEQLLFCSELKGLLASGMIAKEVNRDALLQFMQRGYVTAPLTMITGVHALLPGHYIEFSKGKLTTAPYWDLKEKQERDLSEKAVLGNIRKLVIDAVQEELVSDVPLGVFLSGGMDSALVAASMRAGGIRDIKTFSIGFRNDASGLDESSDARTTAKFYQTDHHEFIISGHDIADRLDSFLYAIDQPSLDGLNTYLVSEIARKHVTVALSGLGGDELFIGYNWQTRPFALSASQKTMWKLLHAGKALLPKRYHETAAVNAGSNDAEKYYALINRYLDNNSVYRIVNGSRKPEHVLDTLFSHYMPPSEDLLRNISYYDLKIFMASRLLRDNDVVAMAHSLEVRFPLIDHRLCEYAWNLPAPLKLKGFYPNEQGYGGKKKLLFEAFKNELPPDLGERAKRGFKMPYDSWLKNELVPFVEEARHSEVLKEYLDRRELEQLFAGWDAGHTSWTLIWQLVILHNWLKRYIG